MSLSRIPSATSNGSAFSGGPARISLQADFDKAIEKALALAKSKDAVYLPGWCGPTSDD
jgi:hypothetical protein